MNCNEKISNLCGTKTYAPCVFYESALPTFSGITHDCVTLEDTTKDLYNLTKDIREQLDLTLLGNSCLTYPLDSQGRITTNNILATLEESYCTLEERVLGLEKNGVSSSGGGIFNLVEDTTPQLGGNLDLNGFNISGITITESQILDFKSYQPILTSGVNIKTINGASLLGNGNISISGSGVVVDNLVSTSTTEPLSANQGRILKSTQDVQQSQININSAKVSNISHPLVETAVPAGALFTDTVYTKPTNEPISYITGLQAALDDKVDDAQVLTNVPIGALFTDTIYDDAALSGRVTTIEGLVDQDVSSGAAPILDATNFTNLPITDNLLLTSSTITTSRDILVTDVDGVNDCTSATDVTITVVDNATVPIPIGGLLPYKRSGDGNIIVTGSPGVTMPTYQTYSLDDVITIRKIATDTWEFVNPPKAINSTTTNEPSGSDQIFNIVSLTQAEYNAGTPVATTIYNITDA